MIILIIIIIAIVIILMIIVVTIIIITIIVSHQISLLVKIKLFSNAISQLSNYKHIVIIDL